MSNVSVAPETGRELADDGTVHNIVTMLGGDAPASDDIYDINAYAPRNGRVERVGGEIVNVVDILGGGTPVSDDIFDIDAYAPGSDLRIGEDGRLYSYTDMLRKAMQSSGSGGDALVVEVTGVHVGDEPPDNTDVLWAKLRPLT